MKFNNDSDQKATSELVDALEAKIGWILPLSYRKFLLDHNGGGPEKRFLIIPGCNAETTISVFLGIGRKGYDILYMFKEWFSELRREYLMIGFDLGGGGLMLSRADGSVWYWDISCHFPESSEEASIYRVASSFEDLLNKLTASLSLPIG